MAEKAMYEQVMDWIAIDFLSGQWPDGQLAENDELKRKYRTNLVTIDRARQQLLRSGFLTEEDGLYWITRDKAIIQQWQEKLIIPRIREVIDKARQIGLTEKRLAKLFLEEEGLHVGAQG